MSSDEKDLDVEAIRARSEAAPKGPWSLYGEHSHWVWTNADNPEVSRDDDPGGLNCFNGPWSESTAAFIAAARTDVPALCDEVTRLRAELLNARSVLAADQRVEDALREANEKQAARITELEAERDDARSQINGAMAFLPAAKDDAVRVCQALRSGQPVVPEDAERTLYFVRQALGAFTATTAPGARST